MRSIDLLENVVIIEKSLNYEDDIEIHHLSDHTQEINEHTCFVCITGNKFDSHELLENLPLKPALVVCSKPLQTDLPYVLVKDTTATLPLLCRNFYGNPSQKLNLIGVTGTDGKTTTSLIVKQLLDHYRPCAYIGTNGFMLKDKSDKNPLTTPKPIQLNRFLVEAIHQNVDYVSMEVSSQGIDNHRVDALNFKVAVFTNLTHEHLDHHKTIENYFQSKLKLFKLLNEDQIAVINIDSSPFGKRIIEETKAKVITYGTSEEADFQISSIKTNLKETTFHLKTPIGHFFNISLDLFGDYNVYNATAALCALHACGLNIQEFIPFLSTLSEIEGRMHIVNCGQPFKVIVDFAHTPNALYCLLSNLKTFQNKDLTVVFGSAGERDRLKRPKMGEVVNAYASKIILTNEDPKSEDEFEIIEDIYKGIEDVFKVSIIPNRKKAIEKALIDAKQDDIIVITGKGNEKIQMFNGYIVEHNDINVAENILKELNPDYTYSIANM